LQLLFGYVVTVDFCGSAVWWEKGAEPFDEGGFSRSVWSKKPKEFAFFYFQVKVVYGVDSYCFSALEEPSVVVLDF